jgi:hypothetical protein
LPFQDQDRIILVSTTAAASSTGPELNIASPFTSVIFLLNVTAASGTSPTLNVRIQEVLTPAAAADQINVNLQERRSMTTLFPSPRRPERETGEPASLAVETM